MARALASELLERANAGCDGLSTHDSDDLRAAAAAPDDRQVQQLHAALARQRHAPCSQARTIIDRWLGAKSAALATFGDVLGHHGMASSVELCTNPTSVKLVAAALREHAVAGTNGLSADDAPTLYEVGAASTDGQFAKVSGSNWLRLP